MWLCPHTAGWEADAAGLGPPCLHVCLPRLGTVVARSLSVAFRYVPFRGLSEGEGPAGAVLSSALLAPPARPVGQGGTEQGLRFALSPRSELLTSFLFALLP